MGVAQEPEKKAEAKASAVHGLKFLDLGFSWVAVKKFKVSHNNMELL